MCETICAHGESVPVRTLLVRHMSWCALQDYQSVLPEEGAAYASLMRQAFIQASK